MPAKQMCYSRKVLHSFYKQASAILLFTYTELLLQEKAEEPARSSFEFQAAQLLFVVHISTLKSFPF